MTSVWLLSPASHREDQILLGCWPHVLHQVESGKHLPQTNTNKRNDNSGVRTLSHTRCNIRSLDKMGAGSAWNSKYAFQTWTSTHRNPLELKRMFQSDSMTRRTIHLRSGFVYSSSTQNTWHDRMHNSEQVAIALHQTNYSQNEAFFPFVQTDEKIITASIFSSLTFDNILHVHCLS